MLRSTSKLALALLLASPSVLAADDYLMYGPSLAVYIVDNDLADDGPLSSSRNLHGDAARGGDVFLVDESHWAADAGHTVTIASAAEWSALTTEQFAAYDALVIGDAGCDLDDGGLLEPVNANKNVWSPAVTGHLFLHTFDNVFHFNNNDAVDSRGGSSTPEQFDSMRDLAVDGIAFAASASGTGLYYANGCRRLVEEEEDRGGGIAQLDFLSELAFVVADTEVSGNNVVITEVAHPSMANQTDAGLSEWGSSVHAGFADFSAGVEVIAIEEGQGQEKERGEGSDAPVGPVILASVAPLGGGESILAIPTASEWGLGAMSLLLLLAGSTILYRRA